MWFYLKLDCMIFLLSGKTFIELHVCLFSPYRNAVNGKSNHESRKERPQKRGGGSRFEPYGNPNKRYRVFVSNIPYDVKWQTLKDLMKEKGMFSLYLVVHPRLA